MMFLRRRFIKLLLRIIYSNPVNVLLLVPLVVKVIISFLLLAVKKPHWFIKLNIKS